MQNKTFHKIIIGDARHMQEVPDESVHLIVTSPPYWQLKDYGSEQQLGFYNTYEEYVNNLNLVWKECYRVLHKGCRLCINIGDQFARSVYYGRYKVIPIRTEIIKFCETLGMDYMGAIIWQKVTTTNTTGGASIMGSYPYPRNGILKLDYEFILIFKKLGNSPKASREAKECSKLSIEEWNAYFSGHWNFPGEKQDGHLAMFPEELPRRLIKMFSFVGETVLDPFLGSGTTSLAARNIGRNSIGYEINPAFRPIIEKKLGVNEPDIFNEASFEFITQNVGKHSYEKEIARLPYVFSDPHALDKKIDPRKRKFGSKIENGDGKNGVQYFTIKRVVEPNLIQLNDGTLVKLLGIVADPKNREKAIAYLNSKLKGQRIFLRADEPAEDDEGNKLAYVYLKNKTFINAHLVRTGLVGVDEQMEYKYKKKFLQMLLGKNGEGTSHTRQS